MDALKKNTAFITLSLFLGILVGFCLSSLMYIECDANNPEENPSLEKLNVALNNPEVIELLGTGNLTSIEFSETTNPHTRETYIQIVFHPEDPDPDDSLTPSMIVVEITDSGQIYRIDETYPRYIPPVKSEKNETPSI